MTPISGFSTTALTSALRTSAIASVCGLLTLPTAHAQSGNPLDMAPPRIVAFDTGSMAPKGTLELNVGARQTSPDNRAGTGNQNYHGGGNYAVSDRFMFGIDAQNYIDPIAGPINGVPGLPPGGISQVETTELALWGKYQLWSNENWSVTGLVSAELFRSMRSDLFGGWNTPQSNIGIYAVKAPITYSPSQRWQLHLSPGVTVMPDEINGDRFYGTIATLGAGVTYRHSNRIFVFGTVETPLSGENTISSADGSWVRRPVWTAGGRYNVTPRVALEGYVTNGWGTTPATSIMTFWPDGEHVLVGGRIVYTPGAKHDVSYRTLSLPPTQAQLNQQQDGFTLGSAATLEPGFFRTDLWYGTGNNAGASINFSTDRDTELQFIFEQYSDNRVTNPGIVPTTDVRYMLGPKLRFMDQNNGNAFSLAGRMLYGRQISPQSVKVGVFYTDLTANYQLPNGLSFTASPKIGAWGTTELIGLGLGVDYSFGNGLKLMAEVTPIGRDGDETTWAAGARYNFGRSGFSVDAQATNALGRQGIGGMIAQKDTRFTLTLSKTFDATGLKFY